ncbi:MAG: DNA repair exonuclease, partial [Thermoguttaceae bacterium]|nr:DNA repair exonuclease [Thermoguttaceae bacterium]
MTNHPFRFIHAADLHLDLPVTGLSHLPEHLREKVLNAPKEAAERLFKEALAERVDFVLLVGGVLDPLKTGAWGPLFLIDQFEKLRLEGIQVFWACGVDDDPANWPDVFALPDNVHRFPVDEIEEVVFSKEGIPHARILGTSLGK